LPSCFQFSYDVIQAPQTTEASFQKSLEITEYYLLVLQHGGTAKRKKKAAANKNAPLASVTRQGVWLTAKSAS